MEITITVIATIMALGIIAEDKRKVVNYTVAFVTCIFALIVMYCAKY